MNFVDSNNVHPFQKDVICQILICFPILCVALVGFSALVEQHPMKSLSSVFPPVCPAVCPSVWPSLNFLTIGSLIFSDIIHDNIWPWNLMNDEARLKKKNGGPNFVPMDLNQAQKKFWKEKPCSKRKSNPLPEELQSCVPILVKARKFSYSLHVKVRSLI